MSVKTLKKLALGLCVLSAIALAAGPHGRAEGGDKGHSLTSSGLEQENGAADRGENPVVDFTTRYEDSLRKSLKEKRSMTGFLMNDLGSGDLQYNPWLLEQTQAEGMSMARKSLRSAAEDSLDQVERLHQLRAYVRSLSTFELRLRDGRLDFEGPSVPKDRGAGDDGKSADAASSDRRDLFRTRLTLDAGSDVGLILRMNLGPLEPRVTYYLVGEDIVGVSLERRLTDWSSVGLNYRSRQDEQRAFASFNFSLP